MRDGRTSYSQLSDDYSMRAQIFYITDINALEDAASHFYSERDKTDTESNQTAALAPTSSLRLPHASIAFTADAQGRCQETRRGGVADAPRLQPCSGSPSPPSARMNSRVRAPGFRTRPLRGPAARGRPSRSAIGRPR